MSELTSQDVEDIEEVHNRWLREELAGNSCDVIKLCTDDVRWIPPNAPPIVGKAAIAHYLSASTISLKDVKVGDVLICGSDSLAYLTSSYHSLCEGEGGSETVQATGTHLWILRKTGRRGEWQVAIVSWSSWEPVNGQSGSGENTVRG